MFDAGRVSSIRETDEAVPPESARISSHEFDHDGAILDRDRREGQGVRGRVAAAPAALGDSPLFAPVLAHHTSPEDVGRVFAADLMRFEIGEEVEVVPPAAAP